MGRSLELHPVRVAGFEPAVLLLPRQAAIHIALTLVAWPGVAPEAPAYETGVFLLHHLAVGTPGIEPGISTLSE